MTYVMGGRKDDVKRMQKPHKKKRPLSAVIEEFEHEDSISRTQNGDESLTNKESDDVHSGEPVERATTLSRVPPENAGAGTSDAASASPSSASTLPSASTSTRTAFSASVPRPSITVTLPADGDSGRRVGSGGALSPNPRGSLRLGRRQALTPSFSPKLSRRAPLTSRLTVQHETAESDDDTLSPTDMTRLRQTADRLHLSTRRPSVMQWRAQYVECPVFPLSGSAENRDVTAQNGDEEGKWTEERTQRINTALDWIINELQEMRAQDHKLARQLLTIRGELQQVKLARSCEEHQDMLDDVQSELEDLHELADVLDLPPPTMADSPLHHLGVTRWNFTARRFSTC